MYAVLPVQLLASAPDGREVDGLGTPARRVQLAVAANALAPQPQQRQLHDACGVVGHMSGAAARLCGGVIMHVSALLSVGGPPVLPLPVGAATTRFESLSYTAP